jgi:hypothetical protein
MVRGRLNGAASLSTQDSKRGRCWTQQRPQVPGVIRDAHARPIVD